MTYYFVAESHTFEFQPKYASEKSSLQLSIHTNSQLKKRVAFFFSNEITMASFYS